MQIDLPGEFHEEFVWLDGFGRDQGGGGSGQLQQQRYVPHGMASQDNDGQTTPVNDDKVNSL